MPVCKKYFRPGIIILLFSLAGVLFWHNLLSINLDIGRHIKLGEIIWETKQVPSTNLFSFTEPDYPFINHHWLSEVIFYGVYVIGGLKGIIVFKVLILVATFGLLLGLIKKKPAWLMIASFILSLTLFSLRSEPRPEIFSYLFLAVFVTILWTAKYKTPFDKKLWLLPVLQMIWVNSHIYFFLGPLLYSFFIAERVINRKSLKKEWGVGLILALSIFLNPHGWQGVFYPLTILNEYGYGVIENEPLLNFWQYQARSFIVPLFLAIFGLGLFGLLSKGRQIKTALFELFTFLVLAGLAWKMQRNIPLFALFSLPLMAHHFPFEHWWQSLMAKFSFFWMQAFKILTVFTIVALIWLVSHNYLYRWMDSSRRFGLGASPAAEEAVNFVREQHISGPVFNNFEIGSFLIWKLYPVKSAEGGAEQFNRVNPDQRVFVDSRPEAYSVRFFNEIYKPMLTDAEKWKEQSEQWKINYVLFNHNGLSENAQKFITRLQKDPQWNLVFLNEAVLIYVKNNSSNKALISQYQITNKNIQIRMAELMLRFNFKDDIEYRPLGSILFFLGFPQAAAQVYEELKENLPRNPYSYQGAGLAYAAMNDSKTQLKAAENLEKAIAGGLDSSSNYFTLALVYANLNRLEEARWAIEEAEKRDSHNEEIIKIKDLLY